MTGPITMIEPEASAISAPDIVTRLRDHQNGGRRGECEEGANEIERLRASLSGADPFAGLEPADTQALRSALDHIARTAARSRTSTRRLRWIEQRARWALDGKPYDITAFDLPADGGPETAAKLKTEVWRLRRELAAALAPPPADRITAALSLPQCERLAAFAAVGPVQRAEVESFADAVAVPTLAAAAERDGLERAALAFAIVCGELSKGLPADDPLWRDLREAGEMYDEAIRATPSPMEPTAEQPSEPALPDGLVEDDLIGGRS